MQENIHRYSWKRFRRHARYYWNQLLDSELTYYASSLSFYTIFTVIPLLMIILSIAVTMPSFQEYYADLKTFLIENLLPVQSEQISQYIDEFLSNAVKLSVVGSVMIVVASMLFFENYEYIVNKVFHTKRRSIWQSVTTYWTLVTLSPIAFGLSIYLSTRAAAVLGEYGATAWFNLVSIFPYIIVWMLFFIIYKISPNTNVDTKAAFITSFIIAAVWTLAKNGFVYYIFYNKTYSTVYGSFSIVLFTFIWIYTSWIIFVYGLKLCYLIDRAYKYRRGQKGQEHFDRLGWKRKQA
ncbi:YihY family inner membrane protein [Sulfurimonas diazotrophicus]|uniref:YihY family inner membrane protein n=1 Tax=Sulfurimonas diazotrophicus TaxID=3131939 RepID=A0ABZ3HDD8_9BACT